MQNTYSKDYPIGFNQNKFNPEIEHYLSWDELHEIIRTNVFTTPDGRKFLLPDNKNDKPLFTYKGNYGAYRSKTNLVERSNYVGIDIDLDEQKSGFCKKTPTKDQLKKSDDDLSLIISILTDAKNDIFFCKRTSSGCGLHIILNMVDVPDGKLELYEKNIFFKVQEVLDSEDVIKSLNYRYNVDMAMLSESQALHINHDPNVLYNPIHKTPAKLYPLKTEYGEGKVGNDGLIFPVRESNDVDCRMFQRFGHFAFTNNIRMLYDDIMRLGIIFFQLWPNDDAELFYEKCMGFNNTRAQERGSSKLFFNSLYKSIKKNIAREYKGKRISVNSLYYIMERYGYQYIPELTLNFTSYLSSIELPLFNAFRNNKNILLEAPTGSGKTFTMFKFVKELAVMYPKKQFVIALPYTGMAIQFAAENSDEMFKIRVLIGGRNNEYPTYTQLPDTNYSKETKMHEVFNMDSNSLINVSNEVIISQNKKQQFSKSKPVKKSKTASKKSKNKIIVEQLFTPEKVTVYHNIWCTTYDSACQIKNIHTLIIDEAHDLVKQIEFRSEALKNLEGIECKNKIKITATPDALFAEVEDYYHICCNKTDTVKPNLNIKKVKGSVTFALKTSIMKSQTSLSFYNNKPYCQQIQTDLINEGINVALYNRDTKNESHQITLQNTGILEKHGLATSYLLEGSNVLNENMEKINICNEYDIDSIRQGAARARRCAPEIFLLLKETEYKGGGAWRFNRAYEYSKKLSKLQSLADEINELAKNIDNDRGDALFKTFDEDMKFIFKYEDNSGVQYKYVVDTAALKAKINEWYLHWLYHKQRDLWINTLKKHFIVKDVEIIENNLKDPKKMVDFEVFKNAGCTLIEKFYTHDHHVKANKKKFEYDDDMKVYAKTHNNPQFKSNWKTWADRYFKMLAYNSVDFDIIGSGIKFSYWQKQADMAVSIIKGGSTSKDKYTSERNKLAFNYLLSLDLKSEKYTPDIVFRRLNRHLLDLNIPPIRSHKSFFASLKFVLELKTKQVRNTGVRYITEIIDISHTGTVAGMRKIDETDSVYNEL